MRNPWVVLISLVVSLAGCGDDGASPSAEPSAQSPIADPSSPPRGPVEPPEAPEAAADAPEETAEARPPAVDLLHALPSVVGVSSVGDFDRARIERLFDGDLETAWSTEAGALEGAFVEVQVPDDAEVTGIAMTAGHTKSHGSDDLFTMNHRIARVRVTRGREVVAEQALDIENREVQRIAFASPGGIFRVEFAELVAGTNDEWREACISEFRVMGHAPAAEAGADAPSPDLEIGPIGGPDRLTAWETLGPYREEGYRRDEGAARSPELRAEQAYARGWVKEAFGCYEMPRLEEGWASIERRRRRIIDQFSMFETRVRRLQARVDAGEASGREQARLGRFTERLDALEDPLYRTRSQASDLIDQMDGFMNYECRVMMGTLPEAY